MISKSLRIRTGSDSNLSDQDWTRTEKFHSPLISGKLLLHLTNTYVCENFGGEQLPDCAHSG